MSMKIGKKRLRNKKNDGIKKGRKKVKLKDCFKDLEIMIEQLEQKIEKNNELISNLNKGFKSTETTFIDELNKVVEKEFDKKVKDKKIIGCQDAYFESYKDNIKKFVLLKIKRRISELKENNNIQKKKLKKLQNKYKCLKKKFGFEECYICKVLFKKFKRGCLCKTDQYMCLICIGTWTESKINGKINCGTDGIQTDHVPCPWCKEEMKNFKCPFCKPKKTQKRCNWCKKNKEIQEIKDNFIVKILESDDLF